MACKRILCLSHTQQLAKTHARGFRTVVEADWCRSVFPRAYGQGLRLQDFEARTSERGYRIASAVTGSVLGVGADLIILDDPMRGEAMYSEAERGRVNGLFDSTVSTRLNNKLTGAIVIIMQRLHADDLVGHVLEQEDWDLVSIPVRATEPRSYSYGPSDFQAYRRPEGELLQPAREGEVELGVARRRLGSLGFSAQYQQQPIPPDGAVIKRDWIRCYDEPPSTFEFVVCSWDTASSLGETNDYSVGTVWGLRGSEFYLLDLVRGRYEVPDLRRHIIALHQRHQANTTLIEETELGRALLHEIRRTTRLRPILRPTRWDKTTRLLAQSPKFEAGQVLLPRNAGYLDGLLQELVAFPNGNHDDQVDSTSQALNYLGQRLARLERQGAALRGSRACGVLREREA